MPDIGKGAHYSPVIRNYFAVKNFVFRVQGKLFSGQVGETYRIISMHGTFLEFMVLRTGGNTTFRRCICPRDSSTMKMDTIIAALQFPCLKKMRTKRLRYINKTRHGFHVLRLQVNAKTSLIVLLVTHQVADGTPDISASSFHVLRFPS